MILSYLFQNYLGYNLNTCVYMFLGMTLHTQRGMKVGLFHRKYIHEYALENMFVYFTKYIILLS